MSCRNNSYSASTLAPPIPKLYYSEYNAISDSSTVHWSGPRGFTAMTPPPPPTHGTSTISRRKKHTVLCISDTFVSCHPLNLEIYLKTKLPCSQTRKCFLMFWSPFLKLFLSSVQPWILWSDTADKGTRFSELWLLKSQSRLGAGRVSCDSRYNELAKVCKPGESPFIIRWGNNTQWLSLGRYFCPTTAQITQFLIFNLSLTSYVPVYTKTLVNLFRITA